MSQKAKSRTFLSYYDEFKHKIYNYLWYRVGFNQEVAEDLTSEIFIKAFNSFDSFDQERSFQSWIYQIAHNHLVNYYKKDKHELGLDSAGHVFEEPLKEVELAIDHQLILKEIDALPESHSQIIKLRYIDDMAYSEISSLLKKEEGAIRTQLSRALSFLKKKLAHKELL